ncbi:response regulator [Algoriphagus machipongonensis]|uniref:DNA-binding response regulator, LuxR family n=1 Tax=Algoriphagus machipongonensis TaxID=388413 RepID=A3HVN1_9BACT|nr:response regulator transcription factor [Algoriphagus machipongonensis]EAZ82203.1 DNA-binding response regulator, LuxR family [Algoriphagus machipongonensis]
MIRIALADDHKLFAKGIESLLDEYDDLLITGIYPNGKELIDSLKMDLPDVILTDLNMPVLDGFGVLKSSKKAFPKIKVIVLSMYDDEKIYKKCMKEGADAFILKDADPDELVYTIHEVYDGRHIANFQRVIQQANQSSFYDAFREKFKLSRREVQIIKLIKDGMQNKEIADDLSLSVQTIETHRKNIHSKLHVSSRIELVNKVQDMNL